VADNQSNSLPHMQSANLASDLLRHYLTEEQFCKRFGISRRTAQRWHRLRKGPRRTKVSFRPYYKLTSVEAWLEAQEEPLVRNRRA
jgi:hypothetical protein